MHLATRERVEQPTTLAQLSTSGDVKELRDQARDTALGTCQFGHISCVGSESPSMESNSDHFCRLALELWNRPKLHLVPITEQRWSGNPSLCVAHCNRRSRLVAACRGCGATCWPCLGGCFGPLVGTMATASVLSHYLSHRLR